MGWKGPARSNDVSNPTPAICLHQGRNEIALLFLLCNGVAYVAPGIPQNRARALVCKSRPIELDFQPPEGSVFGNRADAVHDTTGIPLDIFRQRRGESHQFAFPKLSAITVVAMKLTPYPVFFLVQE